MKLKTILLATYTLFLIIVLSNGALVFAQIYDPWDTCVVDTAYTDLVIDEINGYFSFTVASPAPGAVNLIQLTQDGGGDSYDGNLSPGDTVVIIGFTGTSLQYSGESGDLYYSGIAYDVLINAVEVPEFSSFLILALFMIAALLATIVYRRKLTSQVKQRID